MSAGEILLLLLLLLQGRQMMVMATAMAMAMVKRSRGGLTISGCRDGLQPDERGLGIEIVDRDRDTESRDS